MTNPTASAPTGTTRSKDGTTLAFDRVGEGPAVILVGGAFQHRAVDPVGTELAALLAPRFTVITYDRRGRGASGDVAPYAVEREVEDLDALVAVAGGSACVLGGSSGGVLVLEAAARGLAMTRLALYEPPFIVDDSRAPLPDDYVTRLDALVAAGRRGEAVELFMTAAVGLPAEAVAEMRGMPMWPALEGVAHTLAYDGRIMGDTMSGKPSTLVRFASVTTPTLVMAGGESPEYQRRAVEVLTDTLPGAHRQTLEGQTHEVAPAVLAPVVGDFFASETPS